MSKQLLIAPFVLAAASLAGCSTTHNAPTYSGDVQAAVKDEVAALKAAGVAAGDFVRSSLTSPMPPWTSDGDSTATSTITSPKANAKPAVEIAPLATTVPNSAGVVQDAPPSGVQVFAVVPGSPSGGSSLTVDSGTPQTNAGSNR